MAASLVPWRGGKNILGKKIVEHFPPHVTYIEPFVGGLNVLTAKDRSTSRHEIVNDLHGELINLYYIVKTEPNLLADTFRWDLVSREFYNALRIVNPATLKPMERAHRMLYMMKVCFGGTYGDVFGTSRVRHNSLDLDRIGPLIDATHDRLKNVTIECRDYADLPRTYDHADTLWYLDPPYFDSTTTGYAGSLDAEKFTAFVHGLRGKVVISHRPSGEFTDQFSGAGWRVVSLGERTQQGALNKPGLKGRNYEECLYIRN